MKVSKEIRVGLLGIIALVILYFGFTFLKGLDLFSSEEDFHVFYPDVQGLEVSNPVTFKGVNIGRVVSMKPDYEKNVVDVVLSISKKVNITDQTIANLTDNGLIGGKVIKLIIKPGKNIDGSTPLKSETEENLMQSVQAKLSPTLKNVDSLLVNLNRVVLQYDQSGQAIKTLLASATSTSNSVNGLVAGNSKNLGEITANAAVLTQNLNSLAKNLDSQLKPILTKTNSFTDSLSRLQLGATVKNVNRTVSSLQKMMAEINQGKGTLGKLTSDDSLYINLNQTSASINNLLVDMKSNPKRYVHFSLFGGKKDK